jgi:hypothetical protein
VRGEGERVAVQQKDFELFLAVELVTDFLQALGLEILFGLGQCLDRYINPHKQFEPRVPRNPLQELPLIASHIHQPCNSLPLQNPRNKAMPEILQPHSNCRPFEFMHLYIC